MQHVAVLPAFPVLSIYCRLLRWQCSTRTLLLQPDSMATRRNSQSAQTEEEDELAPEERVPIQPEQVPVTSRSVVT